MGSIRNITCYLLFVFSGSSIAFSQNSIADSLYRSGDLKSSIEAYSNAYFLNPDRHNTYNLAGVYALNKQIDSAFAYLIKATIADDHVQALIDSRFYYLMDDPRWLTLENSLIDRVEATGNVYANREISRSLWRMRLRDQAFYYQLDVIEKNDKDEIAQNAIWELKKIINKENLQQLTAIIDSVGWPTKTMVGPGAAVGAFLVVQHADLETQKKYLPLITKAADMGEADWMTLALLLDRINMREGKPQLYGSQVKKESNGKFSVYEIENPEYVNQRREKIGLGSIEEYLSQWDIVWDIEQKKM